MSSSLPKKFLLFLALTLALWLSARYLLPIAKPFLLAALLALASEPLVRAFQRQTKLSRNWATGLGVTLALGLFTLAAMILGALLLRQLRALAGVIPDLEGTALEGMHALHHWLLQAAASVPKPLRSLATRSIETLFDGGSDLVGRLSAWALGFLSRLLSKLPDSALGIGTWLLASYMISAKLPRMKKWISEKLPPRWHQQIKPLLNRLKNSVFGWLTAQLKLLSVTFLVLSAGLALLRFSHWAVWAAVISLLDALPILGSGMALVPWSIICFIRGDGVRGVGLLGLYAVAALLRSTLEPKLLGKHLGLDPLLTLVAIYAGYQLWGFGGMILAPLLTVTAAQLIQTVKDA